VTTFELVSRIIVVTGCSYGMAWFVQWLLEDFPRLRYALALPKKKLDWKGLPGIAWLMVHKPQSSKPSHPSREAEFG
jgi:hypothetical protein